MINEINGSNRPTGHAMYVPHRPLPRTRPHPYRHRPALRCHKTRTRPWPWHPQPGALLKKILRRHARDLAPPREHLPFPPTLFPQAPTARPQGRAPMPPSSGGSGGRWDGGQAVGGGAAAEERGGGGARRTRPWDLRSAATPPHPPPSCHLHPPTPVTEVKVNKTT